MSYRYVVILLYKTICLPLYNMVEEAQNEDSNLHPLKAQMLADMTDGGEKSSRSLSSR